jgi:type II secretory pathway pseudopilin PulG
MKIHAPRRSRSAGFTLVELITVVSVIVLLFALVAGAYTYADKSAKRNRTEVSIRAIRSALENYREKFGAYPQPSNPTESVPIADKTYIAGGGACLYQALSGDGFNQIEGADGLGNPSSDGQVDENEAANVTMTDMPREMWTSNKSTLYYMVDGFGHPIRYIKAAPTQSSVPGQPPPQATTINLSTYDIWSYGEDIKNITSTGIDTQNDTTLARESSKWIKNW